MPLLSDPVHFSNLKRMALSPAHYRVSVEQPSGQTAAMRFGTLVHCLVLGGDYVVWEGDRRGKAWLEFAEANKSALIVTGREHEDAQAVAVAVRSHPIAGHLLVGEQERSLSWSALGRQCAGRLDVLGDGWVTDLKTCSCSEPYRFMRAARRMAYDAQLSWYQDAARSVGRDIREAYIVAVETSAPFAVTVLRLTAKALEEGRKRTRLWMERLLACEAANEWPVYSQAIVDFDALEADVDLIIDGEQVAA